MNKNIESITPYIPSERGGESIRFKLDWNEGFADITELVQNTLFELNHSIGKISQYVEPDYKGLSIAARKFYLYDEADVECLPFAGSDSAISAVATTFLGDQDKVVMPVPSYDNARLEFQIRTSLIERYRADLSNQLDLNRFINFCKIHDPSLIYLVNPCNPVGYVLDRSFIKEVATALPDAVVLIDEAYIEFSGSPSAIDLINKYPNILVTRTLSKAFSLASLRVGFLFGSKKMMATVNKVRNTKAISLFSSMLATRALLEPQYMIQYADQVIAQRDEVEKILRNMRIPFGKSFGNFVIFRDVTGQISNFLCQAGVLYRDRSKDFEQPGWIRLTLNPALEIGAVINGDKFD